MRKIERRNELDNTAKIETNKNEDIMEIIGIGEKMDKRTFIKKLGKVGVGIALLSSPIMNVLANTNETVKGKLPGVAIVGSRIQLTRGLLEGTNGHKFTQANLDEINKLPSYEKNLFHTLAIKIINHPTASDNDKVNAIYSISTRINPNMSGLVKPPMGGEGRTRHEKLLTREDNQKITDLSTKHREERTNTYKANYTRATELFRNGAGSVCAGIAAKRTLTDKESKAYLMETYFDYKTMPNNWKTENKKNFLGLYYADFSYNTKSTGQIIKRFDALMQKIKTQMYTDKNLKNTPMPVNTIGGITKEQTGGY